MTILPAAEVIGYFYGDTRNEAKKYLEQMFSDWQNRYMFEWRDPNLIQEYAKHGNNTMGYHQDCGQNPSHLIVWSNREQTEVRLLAGTKILKPFKPYAIILVNNYLVEHRVPTVISRDRLFARVHLSNDRMYGDISTF